MLSLKCPRALFTYSSIFSLLKVIYCETKSMFRIYVPLPRCCAAASVCASAFPHSFVQDKRPLYPFVQDKRPLYSCEPRDKRLLCPCEQRDVMFAAEWEFCGTSLRCPDKRPPVVPIATLWCNSFGECFCSPERAFCNFSRHSFLCAAMFISSSLLTYDSLFIKMAPCHIDSHYSC